MATSLFNADKSEILTARRRDDEQIVLLTEHLSSSTRALLGDRLWFRFYHHLPPTVKFLYLSATTLLNRQTPGEEYLTLIQVGDARQRKLLPPLRRTLYVLFESFGEVLTQKLLSYRAPNASCTCSGKWNGVLNLVIGVLRAVDFKYMNQALFFALDGASYTIPMGLLGVNYLSMSSQTDSKLQRLFAFIGWCILAQYIVTALMSVGLSWWRWKRKRRENYQRTVIYPKEVDEKHQKLMKRCVICSEFKLPVCIPCGHVYCWECIHSSSPSADSPLTRCPNCRRDFRLSRTVPLMNY